MSNLKDVYYWIKNTPDPINPKILAIVFKSFWDKNHALDDDYLGPIEDVLANYDCYNLMESIFEIPNGFDETKFVIYMREHGYNMIKKKPPHNNELE